MRLTVLLLIVAFLTAHATGTGQNVTLSGKDLTLKQVFIAIEKQTSYVLFSNSDLFNKAKKVTINAQDMPLKSFLDAVLKDQLLDYVIQGKTITLSEKKPVLELAGVVVAPPVRVKVVDSVGKPLSGATITVKNSKISGVTDAAGTFSLNVTEGNILLVSYVGYETQSVIVTSSMLSSSNNLIITLRPSVAKLEDVEVVLSTGYQNIPKERATGSFAQPDKTIFQNRVSTDVLSRLEGITSGLLFKRTSNGNFSLEVRGRSTINADATPLIVVDNFPYDGKITDINPNDILDITILKDAAAASIWGARAGNGVIVITTKKGKFDQPLRLNLIANLSVSEKPDLTYSRSFIPGNDYINLEQTLYAKGFYDANIANVSTFPVLSPVVSILAKQKAGTISPEAAKAQIDALRGNDFRDELSKYFYRNAVQQQYALNLEGGSDNASYFMSAGYDKNLSGLSGNTDNRITLNSFGVFKPHPKVELSAGFNYMKTTSSLDNTLLQLTGIVKPRPYVKLADDMGQPLVVSRDYNADYIAGRPAFGFLNWQYVPLNEQKLADNTIKHSDIRLRAGLKYIILPGLHVEGTYQYSNGTDRQRIYNAPESYYTRNLINRYAQITGTTVSGFNIPLGGILEQDNSSYTADNFRGQLNLDRTFNKISIAAIAGAEQREIRGEVRNDYDLYGYNPVNTGYKTIDFTRSYPLNPATAGISANIPGELIIYNTINRYRSFFANASVTSNDIYTISGSIRLDQANIFGVKANDKQVPLYSIGSKWDISKEKFYALTWLPKLQIRATYGFSGNLLSNGTAYTTAQYSTSTSIYYPNQQYQINSPGNPNLTWEKLNTANMGVDFEMKNRIITGSIDVYYKKGRNLIGLLNIPSSAGFYSATINYGEMEGKGLDLVLNSRNLQGTFNWNSSFLFSYTTDKVTNYDENAQGINASDLWVQKGKPVNSVFANRWAGLDPLTGDPRGYDKDGNISTNYAALARPVTSEKKWIGRASPDVFGGLRNTLSYQNLSISFNIAYKFNYYFLRNTVSYSDLFSRDIAHIDFTRRWQQPGDEQHTNVPSMPGLPANANRDIFYANSEAVVTRGDHIRLQDIILSYDFDQKLLKGLPIKKLQLAVLTSNLGVLWKANKYGIDPDYQTVSYLPAKTVSFSLKTTF